MEESRAKPVCAEESLDLLNCVTQLPYDDEKCVRLLHALRECVVNKKVKKFTLANPDQGVDQKGGANAVSKQA